ncbi:hypothetical protein [Leuconostoc rapi]|uniref:hypothetical protein n=1 Tax=Leuconostoc rapi TaxID=1406906 RepID=UPI0019592A31|nr:hypothetical protein [Leuconostoc rapi]MBM7435933.1 membrane protein YdbS with pleckstrin-like domain [Leuconostoc rapi]
MGIEILFDFVFWFYNYVSRGTAYSLRWWFGLLFSSILLILTMGTIWLLVLTVTATTLFVTGKIALSVLLLVVMTGIGFVFFRWGQLLYQLTQQEDESGRLVAKRINQEDGIV